MNRFLRCMIPGLTVACFALSAGFADAQVVYYSTLRPVVAAPLVAAPVAVTSYYAPTVVNYAPAPTVAYSPVVAPVTTYYAPTAVAAPLYRRGLFGGLRPVRNAYYIAY
jgi:hypothetical protein